MRYGFGWRFQHTHAGMKQCSLFETNGLSLHMRGCPTPMFCHNLHGFFERSSCCPVAEAPSNISMADKVRLNKNVFWFMFYVVWPKPFATARWHSMR